MCHVTMDGIPPRPATAPTATPGAPRRRRWLVVGSVAWAVLLAVLAGYAARRGEPTVRAQTSVAQALPTVDRAIAEVVTAASPGGAVAEITGYREVDASCTITAARAGARYERVVRLYVPAGREAPLLKEVAAKLPSDYDARVHGELTADAGNYVAVRGGVVGPGQVRIAADTGCRPSTGPVSEAQPPSPTASRAPAEAALATLGVRDARWQTHRVACPRGGAVWTVQADGPAGSAPASLAAALGTASPDAVLNRPDLYAYRSGPAGVVARTHDGIVTVTATTGCGV
jgi:hypothetical protein